MTDEFMQVVLAKALHGENMLLLFRPGDTAKKCYPLIDYVIARTKVRALTATTVQLPNEAWIVCRPIVRAPSKVMEEATRGFSVVVMEE